MHRGLVDDGRVLGNGGDARRQLHNGKQDMMEKESQQLVWDWDTELADRERERKADSEHPFPVDRPMLRELVKQHMGVDVARLTFISSGTFHKAYLVTLVNGHELVARVARRFMPRIKTESEVATLAYLRHNTNIPVPEVYHYDASPYNRLGGEYILESKAPGIPLSKVYHSLSHHALVTLLRNLANYMIPLFGHRFTHIGSLYNGPGVGDGSTASTTAATTGTSTAVHTPRTPDFVYPLVPRPEPSSQVQDSILLPSLSHNLLPTDNNNNHYFHHHHHHHHHSHAHHSYVSSPLSQHSTMAPEDLSAPVPSKSKSTKPPQFHVGPIVSWPFFGSGRGDEPSISISNFPVDPAAGLDRGPWASLEDYLAACAERETRGVRKENEGRARPHRLKLDPDEVVPRSHDGAARLDRWKSSTKRNGNDYDLSDSDSDDSLPGAESNSDEDEDTMYRDYRRYQRSTFLVAHLVKREERVREEMERFVRCMRALEKILEKDLSTGMQEENSKSPESFALDCHDLSLENVFVDEKDHSKITCIIDWESTTTRPLWACAHLPSFLLTSPFASQLWRRIVAEIASGADYSDHAKQSNGNNGINGSSALASRRHRPINTSPSIAACAKEWLRLEERGAWLRYAHKCIEWDGWEEGLVDEILGDMHEHRDEPQPGQLPLINSCTNSKSSNHLHGQPHHHAHARVHQVHNQNFVVSDDKIFEDTGSPDSIDKEEERLRAAWTEPLVRSALAIVPSWKLPPRKKAGQPPDTETSSSADTTDSRSRETRSRPLRIGTQSAAGAKGAIVSNLKLLKPGVVPVGVGVHPRERALDQDGDVCGGRGGELGRRLEAWLSESQDDVVSPLPSEK